eukprot:Mycagemm_TRINITY_DN5495_c0_g1::TRINITY_DN5495_c0_g1_i1::g.1981::m.1981 type:complete len:162 gc:universal TRINITY_DN5495_c0_g1_i1:534-49(-)
MGALLARTITVLCVMPRKRTCVAASEKRECEDLSTNTDACASLSHREQCRKPLADSIARGALITTWHRSRFSKCNATFLPPKSSTMRSPTLSRSCTTPSCVLALLSLLSNTGAISGGLVNDATPGIALFRVEDTGTEAGALVSNANGGGGGVERLSRAARR